MTNPYILLHLRPHCYLLLDSDSLACLRAVIVHVMVRPL